MNSADGTRICTVRESMGHSNGGPSSSGRQLYREPRKTVLERPDSERRGCEGDQLDSLLTEFLSLRSAQAHMLAQPSALKASCSLLPPCSNATAPWDRFSCSQKSASAVHRRALEASSSTAANRTPQSLSPTVPSSLMALPTLMTSTLSSWWG